MDITIEEKKGKRILRFGDNFTVCEIAEIRIEILKALSGKKDVDLDLSAVNECDTAGIQVLLSLMKTLDNHKKTVAIKKASKVVMNTAVRIGVEPERIFKIQEVLNA